MNWELPHDLAVGDRIQITGTFTPPCPRCGKVGPDRFGEQVALGWHMGCAADEAHEHQRDAAEDDQRAERMLSYLDELEEAERGN